MVTTLTFPDGAAPGTAYGYHVKDGTWIQLVPKKTGESTQRTAVFSDPFTLYFTAVVTSPGTMSGSNLVQQLGDAFQGPDRLDNTMPIYQGLPQPVVEGNTTIAAPTPVGSPDLFNVTTGHVLYVPVTKSLNEQVLLSSGFNATMVPVSVSATVTTQSTTATSSTASATTLPASDSATPGNGTVPPTAIPTEPLKVSTGISGGAVAGAVLGGLVVGILCASLGCVFVRRRASRKAAGRAHTSTSSLEYPLTAVAARQEKLSPIDHEGSLTGWQKHLPQEKDDGAITKIFRNIFEQAQMHVEGYYKSSSHGISSTTIETLQRLSGDDIASRLPQTDKQVLLLEGILVRWLVHRISGHSQVQESLLPQDFTKIAKANGWHMESDEATHDSAADRKRGFSQAFAQWRHLTGFLVPDYRNDQTFQRDLNANIERGVQDLDAAFSPWEIPGRSTEKRKQSLGAILVQASEAGIMLFAQPSTYMFDWSCSEKSAVAITPAVVRQAKGASQFQVLVKSTQARI